MGRIELNGMRFRAFHGCLENERINGNDFRVDFVCEYDTSGAEKSDKLEDTLNYASVYEIVAEEMGKPSNLLENVAGRIADRVKSSFGCIGAFEVKVTKYCPPLEGDVESSSVTVRR